MEDENRTSAAVVTIMQNMKDVRQVSLIDIECLPAITQNYQRMEEALVAVSSGIHLEGVMFPGGSMENKAIWVAKRALAFDPLSSPL